MSIRVVDVGARNGLDKRWQPFHQQLEVIAFEPDPIECERLNGLQWPYPIKFLPRALGAHDGEKATLNICKAPGCSSLLRPNLDLVRQFPFGHNMEVVKEYPMVLSRLESVCAVQPDFIKVDTQGTELDVLRGAGRLLDQTIAVELEVEFVPQYERQALFADVDDFMRKQGFVLRGIRRTYWRNQGEHAHPFGGQLIHGDALYLRPELLDSQKGHVILAAYRQHDLLAKFGAHHLIPKEPRLTRTLGKLLSGFSNRELRRFIDRLRPASAGDWHDPDFF